jgi:hypothetical protein
MLQGCKYLFTPIDNGEYSYVFAVMEDSGNIVAVMKTTQRTTLVLALLAIAGFAQMPVSLPPSPDKDPFVGLWRANCDKSQPRLGKKDASYERTITREGEDLIFFSKQEPSKPKENYYRIRYDGGFHQVPFGSLSCKYDSPSLVEGETRALDNQTSYWTREVSSDGLEMKIVDYKDPGRTKIESIRILDRVK